MHRIYLAFGLCGLLLPCLTNRLSSQPIETDELDQVSTSGAQRWRSKAWQDPV